MFIDIVANCNLLRKEYVLFVLSVCLFLYAEFSCSVIYSNFIILKLICGHLSL
jgi:hypothetical protein